MPRHQISTHCGPTRFAYGWCQNFYTSRGICSAANDRNRPIADLHRMLMNGFRKIYSYFFEPNSRIRLSFAYDPEATYMDCLYGLSGFFASVDNDLTSWTAFTSGFDPLLSFNDCLHNVSEVFTLLWFSFPQESLTHWFIYHGMETARTSQIRPSQ